MVVVLAVQDRKESLTARGEGEQRTARGERYEDL